MVFVPLDKRVVLSLIDSGILVFTEENSEVLTYTSNYNGYQVHELFEQDGVIEKSQFYGEVGEKMLTPNWNPVSEDIFKLVKTLGAFELKSEDSRRKLYYLEGIPALQEIIVGESRTYFAVIDGITSLDPEPYLHKGERYPAYIGVGTSFAPRGTYSVNPVDYLMGTN